MSELKRYSLDLDGGKPSIEEDDCGAYVLAADHEAALTALAQRVEELERQLKSK